MLKLRTSKFKILVPTFPEKSPQLNPETNRPKLLDAPVFKDLLGCAIVNGTVYFLCVNQDQADATMMRFRKIKKLLPGVKYIQVYIEGRQKYLYHCPTRSLLAC
jgi:hypothetical protein